jgi:hypothetical protein
MLFLRAALVSYFEQDDLGRLLEALGQSAIPPDTEVHVGTYGIRREAGEQIHDAGHLYSPIFQSSRTDAWKARSLTPEEEQVVDPRRSGAVPPNDRLVRLSTNQRVYWGAEVGRRYRDRIRHALASGIDVDSWQLDELSPRLARPGARPYREFARGILRGLTFGRPALNDPEMKGWVWATRGVLRLAAQEPDNELRHFWRMLNRAAFRVVGEEYANFVGDPVASARRHAAGQRALAGGGPVRRRLAAKYVAGLTPGYRLGGGLGGNVEGLGRAAANRWRNTYVDARARQGVAGFAQYYFRFENARRAVMGDALAALARGMREL